MAKAQKNRASKHHYLSQNQLTLVGFESPFDRSLNPNNRWVILAHKIPWDLLVGTYQSQMGNGKTGADGINPRVAIGSMILKHICNLSDRETVLQLQENMYMQYFIGYSSFSDEEPFDPSLFVDFRKPLLPRDCIAWQTRLYVATRYNPAAAVVKFHHLFCVREFSLLRYRAITSRLQCGLLAYC